MKLRFLLLLALLSLAMFGCQKREIVYDNYIDSFRYKPETEWDYLYLLDKGSETKVAEQKK